jgi:hypothetical protein
MHFQINSYLVPRDKREEHSRLMRRFRQELARLGCDQFEVIEEAESNWAPVKGDGRVMQIMTFRDRAHHQAVQEAERTDAPSQELIREFCELIDVAVQKEKGLLTVSYYTSA